MSVTRKISSLFHRFIRYVNTTWLGQAQQLNVDLIPEITRYFLSAAVEDRVRFLARDDQTQEDTFRPFVLREYNARIEDGLRIELKQNFSRCPSLVEIEKNLTGCKLPMNWTDELLASPASLWQVLRTRGAFTTRRLRPHEAQVLFGIILRAVQQFTLDIVRVDYPAKGKGTDVPAEAQQIIRKILRKVDEIARLIESPVEVKSAAKAETELRVAVARAKGAACLPLRPIPTSALEHEDLEKHYVGRPDEDALRLARQIRHADGTILVTGYRGVGKSSFVNRVIFHTLEAQKEFPKDGWIVVPVNVNLAKIAGVQNILRLTLRAVREALLESNSRQPRRIRARDSNEFGSVLLPLRTEEEIERLEEAYIRATYKVTMSQTNGTERRSDLGSSFSLGASKLATGVVGVELGKFLEAGVKRTKIEKINRELNLLDYDENAAEQDLAKLIYSLATPRPLYGENGGKNVQIKLVFVFDELDKMDVEQGLKPMIEGLKNLFLQQYSVFILVTSKRFYYDLLKDRAIEDAMLNSYFSAIVHVPLLSFAQARKMVENWVDWDATEQLQTKSPEELKLIEQLTRVLVYRSFGNPRDIIRELRLMQEWADTEQPYLTDRLSKSPALQIFAAIQDCVEKTAVPQQSTSVTTRDSDGSVALVSERLVGDEARLEQIRRGLYILTEELINRQTLTLDNRKPDSATTESVEQKTNGSALWQHQLEELLGKITKPATSSSEPTALAKIQQDNFSLLSVEDVRQLAKRLGGYLSLVHDNPDLFPTAEEWGQRRPLFLMQGVDQLRVTNDFYALTGRQALAANPESHESVSHKMTPEDLTAEAENLAGQASWASKLAAINIISQLPSAKVSPTLEQFLWTVMADDHEASHRLAAAERLTPLGLFKDSNRIALIQTEKDERIRSILIRLLGGASNKESRKLATDTIIQLLKDDAGASARILSDSVAIEALTVLQTVADRDETDTVLKWLISGLKGELVESTTIKVLTTFAEKFQVDTAEKVLTTEGVLRFFLQGSNQDVWQQLINPGSRPSETTLKLYLREVFRPRPLEYAAKLLSVDEKIDVDDLLAYLWEVSLENSEELSSVVFTELLNRRDEQTTSGKKRLLDSLRKTREFQNRLLPSLNRALSKAIEGGKYKDAEADSLRETLKELEKQPEPPQPPKPKFNPADIFKRPTSLYNFGTVESTRSERNWNLTVGLIAASAVSFLLAALFFRRGLDADASFGTILASRFILLFMDAAIAFPFFQYFLTDRQTKSPAETSSSLVGAIAPAVLLVVYLHGRYIAPLTLWTQVVQFLVHLPAVFFAYAAVWLPVERTSARYSLT